MDGHADLNKPINKFDMGVEIYLENGSDIKFPIVLEKTKNKIIKIIKIIEKTILTIAYSSDFASVNALIILL